MTREDFTTLWRMVTGVWPRLDTPETAAAWWGLIGNYPAHHAQAAVRHWATDRRAAPTPADVIEGIRRIAAETARKNPQHALAGARCDECDSTGFVWLSFDGQGTVRRCARGCMPPELDLTYKPGASSGSAVWAKRYRATTAKAAARRAELGEHAYLRERGFDPDRYRITGGMIVARPSERQPSR